MSLNTPLTAATLYTVLCVDDDADDLFFLTTAVQQANAALRTATYYNGEEALRYLQGAGRAGHLPSLIIMDINMPGMDGKQALAKIKADPQLRDIPIVMYTTSSSAIDRAFCAHYGVLMVINCREGSAARRLLSFCLALFWLLRTGRRVSGCSISKL